MQAFLDFVIRNLLALWPIARVYEWQLGMIVRGGKIQRELAPGLHWRWWFFDEVKTWPRTDIGLDLATGNITTCDGVPVSVSANMTYRMTSIATNYRRLWSTENSLKLISLGHLASYCAKQDWPSLQAQRERHEEALRSTLDTVAREWGCEVLRVHLTDCVHTRAHSHFVDGALTR